MRNGDREGRERLVSRPAQRHAVRDSEDRAVTGAQDPIGAAWPRGHADLWREVGLATTLILAQVYNTARMRADGGAGEESTPIPTDDHRRVVIGERQGEFPLLEGHSAPDTHHQTLHEAVAWAHARRRRGATSARVSRRVAALCATARHSTGGGEVREVAQ